MLRGAIPFALLMCAAIPAAAQAQGQAPQALDALAADLAYGFCPMLMNGEAVLDGNSDLIDRGFPTQAERGGNARFPEFALLGQSREDGDITVGGIAQSLCQVNVVGSIAPAALTALRNGVGDLGLPLEADPANSGAQAGGTVETLKLATGDGNVIRVQFFEGEVGDGTPLAGFQILVQEQ